MIHEDELKALTIPYSELKIGKKLGKGGFGVVYKAEYLFGDVAVKELKDQEDLNKAAKKALLDESKIMKELRSSFIVQLYGVCLEPEHVSLVMEYMPKGSLFELLKSDASLEWPQRYAISLDIGKGIYFLHKHKIIHRDLKSTNVLLDTQLRAKLCDFGLAKVKNHMPNIISSQFKGTWNWAAPELLEDKPLYSAQSDIYAYGMVLWEIAARKVPFQGIASPAVIQKIRNGEREAIPGDTPPPFKKTIKSCWAQIPNERSQLEEAIQALEQGRQQVTVASPSFLTSLTLPTTSPSVKKKPQPDAVATGPHYVSSNTTVSLSSPHYVSMASSALASGPQYIAPLSLLSEKQGTTTVVSKASTPGEADFHTGYGLFSKSQYKQSLPYFLKAAKEEYPPAFIYLCQLYAIDGLIGPENETESEQWHAKAIQHMGWFQTQAKTNQPHAQFNLGFCYKGGRGSSKDDKKAAELFQKAANQGLASAQLVLGLCYAEGEGVAQDIKKAVELYQQAADQGDAIAQSLLGACYAEGEGVPQDIKKAVELFQQAADQGLALAQLTLGKCYEDGQGVPQDYKKAAELYQQAADQGDADAQFSLGRCYANGQGVPQDYKKAAELYQQAADQGYASAQYNLGVCYQIGEGVPQDFKKSVEFFQQAADQGHTKAQAALKKLLQNQPQLQKAMGQSVNFFKPADTNNNNQPSPNKKDEKTQGYKPH